MSCGVVEIYRRFGKSLIPESSTIHTTRRNTLEKRVVIGKVRFLLQEMLLALEHCCGRLQNIHCGQLTTLPVRNRSLFRVLLNELETSKSAWASRDTVSCSVTKVLPHTLLLHVGISDKSKHYLLGHLSSPFLCLTKDILNFFPCLLRRVINSWAGQCNSVWHSQGDLTLVDLFQTVSLLRVTALTVCWVTWPNWLGLPCVCAIRRQPRRQRNYEGWQFP
jgi:hypothetical protein